MLRRSFGFLTLALAVAGCRSKHEADTAQEFFDKFVKAARAGDHDTLWLMFSASSQNLWLESARAELDRIKPLPAEWKKLQETYDLPADPAAVTPEIFAKARWKKERKKHLENAGAARFVEQQQESDRIILTLDWPPEGRQEWVLVREKKYLRLDDVATGMRNRSR